MSIKQKPVRAAVLDDYQNVALSLANWAALEGRADVTVFNDHIAGADAVVSRLLPFDVVCVMRERTPLTRAIIERLPKLRLIASTAFRMHRRRLATRDLLSGIAARGRCNKDRRVGHKLRRRSCPGPRRDRPAH